jgi:hypothetical protein
MPPSLPKTARPGERSADGDGHAPDYSSVLEAFGVEFHETGSGAEVVADDCPFCGTDRCYLNTATGLYHCKKCEAAGNVTTYLTWVHGQYLKATTPAHYSALGAARGIAPQTLRAHGLAYDPVGRRWLIPFRSGKGSIVNVQFYQPDPEKRNKWNLPVVPLALYEFERTSGTIRGAPGWRGGELATVTRRSARRSACRPRTPKRTDRWPTLGPPHACRSCARRHHGAGPQGATSVAGSAVRLTVSHARRGCALLLDGLAGTTFFPRDRPSRGTPRRR